MESLRLRTIRSTGIAGLKFGLEILGSILIFGGIILLLHPILGKSSRLVITLGVSYWGIRRGLIGGLLASLVSFTILIPILAQQAGLEPVPPEVVPFGFGLLAIIGGAIGQMSDMRHRLKLELVAREQAEGKLREEHEAFRIFFEGNPNSMWIFDMETFAFLKVNQATANIYGYSIEEFGRMNLADLQLPENLPTLQKFIIGLTAEQKRVRVFERRHRKRDGSIVDIEIVSQQITYQGRPARLGLATDVTDQRRKRAELEHEANHDALTSLANRASFHRSLEQTLERSRETEGTFSVFLMDLDRFKEINDTVGHAFGDLVLREVGPRLASSLRADDVLARLGGDEFGLLMPGADSLMARKVGQRILAAFEEPFVFEDHNFDVGTSIGIVTHPDHGGGDLAALLNMADLAMYAAKRGRTGVVAYGPELEAASSPPGEPGQAGDEDEPLLLPYRTWLERGSG